MSNASQQNEILKWAAQHKYPAIVFPGGSPTELDPVQGLPPVTKHITYAIGVAGYRGNKTLWEIAIRTGRDDLVEGVAAYIQRKGTMS